MSNVSSLDDLKKSVALKCPSCGKSDHYYPAASLIIGVTIFHGPEYGRCLHCDYYKELSPSENNKKEG